MIGLSCLACHTLSTWHTYDHKMYVERSDQNLGTGVIEISKVEHNRTEERGEDVWGIIEP